MHSISATISSYFSAIGRKDREAWVACFADDSVANDPAHAPARAGKDAHRAFFDAVTGMFESVEFRAVDVKVCGDEAAVVFHAKVRAKNGKLAEAGGIDVFTFDAQAKIRMVKGFWDPSPLFAAAGA